LDEVEYVTGRFTPEQLANYLTARREGRGISPRVERSLRQRIIDEVINPYEEWKRTLGLLDWNDLAVRLANQHPRFPYDVIIVDETQDFSANQLRAINNNLAEEVHSLTLVVDTAQRIYARGFTWQEAGITVRPENIRRLRRNYRNTIEIAHFAAPLIEDIPLDDDATIPDFSNCVVHGQIPIVLKGRFAPQTNYVIRYIQERINLHEESVAILHPLGGGWFNFIKSEFDRADLRYIEITRESEWPEGGENIAFSTLHSSKGLEFDHVIIIGLNSDITPHGKEEGDDRLITLRRLLAMGIGRARRSVILGYKPEEASDLIDYLDPSTYQELEV
jgi:superfamily I DNA/RNA helicase